MGLYYVPVTIANGAATSNAIEANGRRVAGIIGPAAWTAADISFEVYEPVLGLWRKVVDNAGALVKITGVNTNASEFMIPPEIADRLVASRIRICSSNTASEADVTQGAERSLVVLMEDMQK